MGGPRFAGVQGPLAPFEAGFRIELQRLGYVERVVELQLQLMAAVSHWLECTGAEVGGFDADAIAAVLADRSRVRRSRPVKSLGTMLAFLRDAGVVPYPLPPVLGPVETMLDDYRHFFVHERGLTSGTARGYVDAVRPFIATRLRGGQIDVAGIVAADVFAFVSAVCPGKARGPAQLTATALRSVLGWWHLDGLTETSLAVVVPAVASWRLARLVEPLADGGIECLLRSCDRDGVAGRRDYAMLSLLARLGLRRGEVAGLRLDDIDWRGGEIVVRGKGPKEARLPLPVDVGEAVADYLRHGRPATAQGRTVFVRVQAPHRQLSPTGVTQAVFAAGQRAGLGTVHAHRLRHSAATSMLRGGASLADVGQVLRHQRVLTTAIYAKVDREALRTIARPWPKSAS